MSPDGQTLAFTRAPATGTNELYILPLESPGIQAREPEQITFDRASIRGLAWTSDGQELVVSSTRGERAELWRVRVTGRRDFRRIRGVGDHSYDVEISRRSDMMIYARNAVGPSDIWRLTIDRSIAPIKPVKVISSGNRDLAPSFSPDGTRIAFQSDRSGADEIWICNQDGTDPKRLTSFGHFTGHPQWSPDGRGIAFESQAAGTSDIYTVSPAGGEPVRITTDPGNEVYPTWSRDGNWIYFGSSRSGRFEIWKMPAKAGKAVQVTTNGGLRAFESPDGKDIYYTKSTVWGVLWKCPLRGGLRQQSSRVIPILPSHRAESITQPGTENMARGPRFFFGRSAL